VPFERAAAGFEAAFGTRPPDLTARHEPAIDQNWIKAWPCCLQSHGAIEAALRARERRLAAEGPVRVSVHPVSLQAASYDEVRDGLQAKFSIPYLTALTLMRGPPTLGDFHAVDQGVQRLARERIEVRGDPALLESEAVLTASDGRVRVEAALGSPERPLTPQAHGAKLHALAGGRLDGALDDRGRPAAELLAAAGVA
jgi:2-methylcitrate dehydratase PrpD